jgi:hypothetical protein
VGAQTVRAADRRVGWDEADGSGSDAIMGGHPVGDELARPQRPEHHGAGERGGKGDGCEARHPSRSEHGAGDEEGNNRRRVVELDRRLGRGLGEEIRGELWQRRDE